MRRAPAVVVLASLVACGKTQAEVAEKRPEAPDAAVTFAAARPGDAAPPQPGEARPVSTVEGELAPCASDDDCVVVMERPCCSCCPSDRYAEAARKGEVRLSSRCDAIRCGPCPTDPRCPPAPRVDYVAACEHGRCVAREKRGKK